jgi:hypothetical protein
VTLEVNFAVLAVVSTPKSAARAAIPIPPAHRDRLAADHLRPTSQRRPLLSGGRSLRSFAGAQGLRRPVAVHAEGGPRYEAGFRCAAHALALSLGTEETSFRQHGGIVPGGHRQGGVG